MSLDSCKNCCQKDRDKCEECRSRGKLCQCRECPGKGTQPTDDRGNDSEDNGALAVIGDGVEVFGRDKYVQTLDKGVVQDEHDRSGIPCPGFTPEKHLANIADISNLRVP